MMFPFFSKAPRGQCFGSAAEFSQSGTVSRVLAVSPLLRSKEDAVRLAEVTVLWHREPRDTVCLGKGWSQTNSKCLLQDFFHKPPRTHPTPFLIHALLSPSATYVHLRLPPFCLLRHLLADWAICRSALQGHSPQNVLIMFYSHFAGQHFTLILPSVHD